MMFQYMLLLRGATPCRQSPVRLRHCFNTCSSCEEQRVENTGTSTEAVSIHAPLARSNSCDCGERGKQRVSIHAPLARSNAPCADEVEAGAVSIHAPLARSNFLTGCGITTSCCFNTCSSCEEQLCEIGCSASSYVSIHAPLARSNLRVEL